jgi:pyruvate formate-lyase activating enzyme-like uncharacterized protein
VSKERLEQKIEPIPEELSDISKAPKVSAKQKALNTLVRELTTLATQIVLKVATCTCNHKDTCDLYKKAKEMAIVIDKLQEMRGE